MKFLVGWPIPVETHRSDGPSLPLGMGEFLSRATSSIVEGEAHWVGTDACDNSNEATFHFLPFFDLHGSLSDVRLKLSKFLSKCSRGFLNYFGG